MAVASNYLCFISASTTYKLGWDSYCSMPQFLYYYMLYLKIIAEYNLSSIKTFVLSICLFIFLLFDFYLLESR